MQITSRIFILASFICISTLFACGQSRLGSEDALLFEVEAYLENSNSLWLRQWREINSSFNIGEFNFLNINQLDINFNEINFFKEEWLKIYENYIFYSPDSSMFIDIYSTRVSFENESDNRQVLYEIDTKVYLIDKLQDKASLVLFSGSIESYHDCFWLDNNRFVILGSEEVLDEQKEMRVLPFIMVYQLDADEVLRFESNRSYLNSITNYFEKKFLFNNN